MDKHNLKRSFNAGKSLLQRDPALMVAVIIGIVLDSTMIYVSLSNTIHQAIILNLIVTIGSCIVIDGSPALLSTIIFMKIDPKLKTGCFVLLAAIMARIFWILGCFRIETIQNLFHQGLGLVESSTIPGMDSLGHLFAEMPVATTVVIFVCGVIGHSSDKYKQDIMLIMADLYDDITDLNKVKLVYGTTEQREAEMESYITAEKAAISEDIENSRYANNETFDRMLAEHINADPAQISTIMKEKNKEVAA